jgi:hypothetical protein
MAAWQEDRWLQENIELCKKNWWKINQKKRLGMAQAFLKINYSEMSFLV